MSVIRGCMYNTLSPAFNVNSKKKKNLDPAITTQQQPNITTMASYDSDSSDGGEFEETNVLLGYASKDAEEDTISKLGGHPVRTWAPCNRCVYLCQTNW